MKVVIGIISYIPENIRKQRELKLTDLVNKCSDIFPNINIVIIAQNGKDFKLERNDNIEIFEFDKLGIVGARNKLRDGFINSEYDYLIMFDDDNILTGTKENGDKYLELINNHPYGFGIFDGYRGQLWGFAISKSLFKKVEYPEQTTEAGEVFEDTYFSNICKFYYPNFIDLHESGVGVTTDGHVKSTWGDDKKYNIKEMEKLTNNLIDEYKNKHE